MSKREVIVSTKHEIDFVPQIISSVFNSSISLLLVTYHIIFHFEATQT